jgi:hypothetical protein
LIPKLSLTPSGDLCGDHRFLILAPSPSDRILRRAALRCCGSRFRRADPHMVFGPARTRSTNLQPKGHRPVDDLAMGASGARAARSCTSSGCRQLVGAYVVGEAPG